MEALGAGPLDERTALVSLGTYIAAMVPGSENHRTPAHFWTNFACRPHRYLYESHGIRRGMWTLTWFLDLLGDEVAERAASLGLSRERYLEQEAAEVPAGSDGLLTVLDWLAPTDRPFRKGIMLGFDARHTRGHVYRSIMEAIALTMKHHVDAMCGELGIELEEVVVAGGGATSPLFMQIFADAFGLPASRSAGGGGASLGAAICAAAAAGLYPDIESAAAAMAGDRESFLPDPAGDGRLRSARRRRLPGHPHGHGSAPRAVVPDLPLTSATRGARTMELSRDAIVARLQEILSPEHVVTDEQVLRGAERRQLPQARERSSACGRCPHRLPWRWPGAPRMWQRCSPSRTSTGSTSCRARAERPPRAGSRHTCPTRSCSTAVG